MVVKLRNYSFSNAFDYFCHSDTVAPVTALFDGPSHSDRKPAGNYSLQNPIHRNSFANKRSFSMERTFDFYNFTRPALHQKNKGGSKTKWKLHKDRNKLESMFYQHRKLLCRNKNSKWFNSSFSKINPCHSRYTILSNSTIPLSTTHSKDSFNKINTRVKAGKEILSDIYYSPQLSENVIETQQSFSTIHPNGLLLYVGTNSSQVNGNFFLEKLNRVTDVGYKFTKNKIIEPLDNFASHSRDARTRRERRAGFSYSGSIDNSSQLPVHKRTSVQYSSLVGPSFLNSSYHQQVRALAGQTAVLACVIRNLHNYTVILFVCNSISPNTMFILRNKASYAYEPQAACLFIKYLVVTCHYLQTF